MLRNKNSGTRTAKQTVDTTANEGSKTMGRVFLDRAIFLPPALAGRDTGRQKAGLCFPVCSLWNRHHAAVVIKGGCGVTVLPFWQCNQSHPRDHMVEFIAYGVHPCIMSVRSPTCYLCKQRLHFLLSHSIFIEQGAC